MWKVCEPPEGGNGKPKSWARWYSVRGKICEHARNTETGEVKRIGLEEAKACLLLPSVTTILKISVDLCGVEGWDVNNPRLKSQALS